MLKRLIFLTLLLAGLSPLSLADDGEFSAFLKQAIERHNQAKEIEEKINQYTKDKPLRIAYTFLHNKENGRVCYIEAFNRTDIVPDFAEPATYKEALSLEKPSAPKCSDEEIALVSFYQDRSYLSIETAAGPAIAPLVLGGMLCFSSAWLSYEWVAMARTAIYKDLIKKGLTIYHEKIIKEIEQHYYWGRISIASGVTVFYGILYQITALGVSALIPSVFKMVPLIFTCSFIGSSIAIFHISVDDIFQEHRSEDWTIQQSP